VAAEACVENFRAWMTRTRSSWSDDVPTGPIKALGMPMVYWEPADVSSLRGKDLACWCSLDQPCHADVLLELANAPDAVDPHVDSTGKPSTRVEKS
jgi:hypothetical protein